MQRLVIPCLFAAALAGGLTAQQAITLPANAAGVEGSSSNNFPWGFTGNTSTWGGLRVQSIYDSSNLTSQGVTGPIEITGLRWRVNGNVAVTGGTYSTNTIGMAAATIDYTAISTTWQSVTTVYTGAVNVDSVPATTPGGWYVSVSLDQPFLYDPTTGQDLIIDTDRPLGAGLWTGSGSGTNDVSGAGSMSARTFASSNYPVANGISLDHGVVVELEFNPCARFTVDNDASTGTVNFIPFGTSAPTTLMSVFASNNQGSPGGAVYFDITPNDLVYLHGLEVNTGVGAGTDIIADIYYRSGTYVGFESSPTGWDAWTAAKGTAAALDSPSRLDFNRGLALTAGTWGIAVVARNFGHHYTNGANVYTDANVTLTTGSATNVPFTGAAFTPRSANVTLRYQLDTASWHNQLFQTVLRSSDLGSAGAITGLAFAPSTTGRHYNRLLMIRMAHKPANYTLDTTFAVNMTGATTVLNENYYSWHMRGDSWEEIGLSSPFAYDGTSDVVVEIFARGNHMSTGTPGGFHRGTEPRVWAAGWAYNAAPLTGTLDSAATKIRVQFDCAETSEFGTSCGPARADGFSSPVAGTAYWFDIHDAVPSSAAILVMGFNYSPINLTQYGYTNCWAWNDNVASVFKVVGTTGLAFHQLNLPNTNAINGLRVYGFWANIDASQPGGLTFTNYVRMIIGAFGYPNPNS